MATIAQILPRKFAGREWSMREDDYSTLVFHDAGPILTEAQIRSFSAEVDAEIAVDERKVRQLKFLIQSDPQVLLIMIDVLTDFCEQLNTNLRAVALTGALNPARLNELRQRLNNAKNVT